MRLMGGKARALAGPLGTTILGTASHHDRFVDLFTGSGAVAGHVASRLPLPVLACDTQRFSTVLAAALLTPGAPDRGVLERWACDASDRHAVAELPVDAAAVLRQRDDSVRSGSGFVARAYGGHYFSQTQAQVLDRMLLTLPPGLAERTAALALTIRAASTCAAATGHMGQPLQPTPRGLPHINKRWALDPAAEAIRRLPALLAGRALGPGRVVHGDARDAAAFCRAGDLVFLDPPYAPVQYSRLYHVLEALAVGGYSSVHGAGRAPALTDRFRSPFSTRAAGPELAQMLDRLLRAGATVILTFPADDRGLGVTGADLAAFCARRAYVRTTATSEVVSTLGGGSSAVSRKRATELVIHADPGRRA